MKQEIAAVVFLAACFAALVCVVVLREVKALDCVEAGGVPTGNICIRKDAVLEVK